MAQRVLVVEDDRDVADLLASELQEVADVVDKTGDGATAVALARSNEYALVTVDLMLPRLGGPQMCAQLRAAAPRCPILAVTGRSDVIATLLGMSNGVDDYVLKPFNIAEVRAKTKQLLERPRQWHAPGTTAGRWAVGDISFDLAARRIALREQPVEGISSTEFELLYFLARNPGTFFSAKELSARLWGLHHPLNMRNLGVNFVKLRKKLAHGSYSYVAVTNDERYMFVDPQMRTNESHGKQTRIDSPA